MSRSSVREEAVGGSALFHGAPVSVPLPASRLEFIELSGHLCQLVGLPRSMGQIYGLLYLSLHPLSLDDIAAQLAISKASASTGARHLLTMQAVRQVWIPGERKDHYEVQADLGEVLRANYEGLFKPKLEKSQRKLEALLATLDDDRRQGRLSASEHALGRERLASIQRLQQRLTRLLPLAEKLL